MKKLAESCKTALLLAIATSIALFTISAAVRSDPEQAGYVQEQTKYIQQCISKKAVADVRRGDILIAIQRQSDSRIQPIAILRNNTLLASSDSEDGAGQEIEHFDVLFDLRTNEKHQIVHQVDFDAINTGCFWFGKFKNPRTSVAQRKVAGRWSDGGNLLTIMASASLSIKFWTSSAEADAFYKALPPGYCTARDRGEPEKFSSPCEPPQIYAVSDLNHNGRVEYWFSYTTTYDQGFGVAEIVDGKLKPIHEICPGCSD